MIILSISEFIGSFKNYYDKYVQDDFLYPNNASVIALELRKHHWPSLSKCVKTYPRLLERFLLIELSYDLIQNLFSKHISFPEHQFVINTVLSIIISHTKIMIEGDAIQLSSYDQ
jgi:hypothetical protein